MPLADLLTVAAQLALLTAVALFILVPYCRFLYWAAFIEPPRRFPDGPPARVLRRAVGNVFTTVLALDVTVTLLKLANYPISLLIGLPLDGTPLPVPPLWRPLVQFVQEGALAFVEALGAVLVLRLSVLGGGRLRAVWLARQARGDST
jgi:hypothetical protein